MTYARRRLKKPVFVVGCCNSGTTILKNAVLASDPGFSGPPGEGQSLMALPRCMKLFRGKRSHRLFAHPAFIDDYHLTEAAYREHLAEQIDLAYSESCSDGKRFLEKSPPNSIKTRLLQSIYPDASFVIIVRNGYAVIEGIRRKRLLRLGLSTSIEDAALQWTNCNQLLTEERRLLNSSILVRYEELVQDPESTLARILSFLGCQGAPATIPQYDRRRNEEQVKSLSDEDLARIRPIAGTMLSNLGYS